MPIEHGVLETFRAHGIPSLIERERGELPWSLGASIVEIESGGDPSIYNYYKLDHKTGKIYLHVGRWERGMPLPDGLEGRPNAHAVGLLQIIRKYPRGLTLAERFDAGLNARVIFPELRTWYRRASAAGLRGHDLYGATYFGHNQGPGPLGVGLKHAAGGLEAVIRQSGLERERADRALVFAIKVATHADWWAAIESEVKGGAPC